MKMVTCKICEENDIESEYHFLGNHLEEVHDISISEYQDRYGSKVDITSEETWEEFVSQAPERVGTERFENIIRVGEIEIEANDADPASSGEKADGYKYPEMGPASESVQRLARAIKYGRNTYIYGHNGTGKSASTEALAADMNLEFSKYPMREGLDPETYLGMMEVEIDEETGQNKTEFQEGKLLQDLRGRVGEDGERRGVLILIDDIDRAPAEYHEVLRHVLESNSREVFVPELKTNVEIHPDTRIVATANSAGRGDNSGFYSSVQVMDESILDRFERAIEFHFLEPEEERTILGNKFPEIQDEHPEVLDDIISVTENIRDAIQAEELYITFSHRRLEQWAQSVEEHMQEFGFYEGIVHQAAKDWLDWYDKTTRDGVIQRFVDLHTAPPSGSKNDLF
jgi:MoxR-like ATPase